MKMKNYFSLYCSKKFMIMACGDLFCFIVVFFFALIIRFDFNLVNSIAFDNLQYMPIVVGSQALSFLGVGVYADMWRYTSIHSIIRVCLAVALSLFINLFYLMYFWGQGFSRGVLVIDAMLVILSTGGLRAAVRMYFEHQRRISTLFSDTNQPAHKPRQVIILGAGYGGEFIIREMLKSNRAEDIPVAILDDDPHKVGRTIHGVLVVDKIGALPEIVKRFDAHMIFICIPSAKGQTMRRIVELCENSGVKYKTLPGVNELIHKDIGLNSLREVSYDDLLGREPVKLELDRIKGYLSGKVVLVTGAGGSIGSELCRKIISFEPRQILLLDAGEFNLFSISSELRGFYGYKNCVPLLANLCDASLLHRIFNTYKPQVVFHAAAYKHVPLIEINPWQAVFNNIVATRNLLELSHSHEVGTFVLVSTDKAVRPTNVMGASKRVTELLLQAYMAPPMRWMAVRFGNVIGSSGSVVPFFIKQIKAGKPVTVTHPEVTRFFMSIDEAAELIIQAGGMGEGGETFLIKMGHSVRIKDMAADLIRLCGKVPDRDVPIIFTGLREGEKLYEELITAGENVVPTPHDQLMKLRGDIGGRNQEDQSTFREMLASKLEELINCANNHDAEGIKRKLKDIVHDYMPQDIGRHAL